MIPVDRSGRLTATDIRVLYSMTCPRAQTRLLASGRARRIRAKTKSPSLRLAEQLPQSGNELADLALDSNGHCTDANRRDGVPNEHLVDPSASSID